MADDSAAARNWRLTQRGMIRAVDLSAPPAFINYTFTPVTVATPWGVDVRRDGV